MVQNAMQDTSQSFDIAQHIVRKIIKRFEANLYLQEVELRTEDYGIDETIILMDDLINSMIINHDPGEPRHMFAGDSYSAPRAPVSPSLNASPRIIVEENPSEESQKQTLTEEVPNSAYLKVTDHTNQNLDEIELDPEDGSPNPFQNDIMETSYDFYHGSDAGYMIKDGVKMDDTIIDIHKDWLEEEELQPPVQDSFVC